MGGRRPNFVVILTDDQGYGDLSCMGATDFRTPHLDRVAASGARFTSWYSASPVCSPSRAALLTGRYPGNAGVRSILAGHRTASGLPRRVPTLATALRAVGYRTAMFGKWHLGLTEGCRPEDHGFDEWFGFLSGCVDYYSHIHYWQHGIDPLHDLWEDGREVFRNGRYVTELIAERAVDFVRRRAPRAEPFLLYLPFNAPHYPMHAPAEYVDRFRHLAPDRRIMAAMLSAVDDAVGRVAAELERQGVLADTCIFFQSDNGPSRESRNWLDGRRDPYYGGSAGALRGHKFSLFEGGIRVPGLLSWPARIPSGQVLHDAGAAIDVFPTLLRAAGGEPGAFEGDGADILPWVTGAAPAPRRDLFWEMGRQTAMRRGPWKLVLNGQLVEGAPPEDAVHLALVTEDPGERRNLAGAEPALAAEMREAAEAWRARIERRWAGEWEPLRSAAGGAPANTG
jgi:arylsulfatase A-like enzyme